MAKAYGYERGLVKYIVKSPFLNFIPMYIFGGGVLAFFDAITHTVRGSFIEGVLFYFITKYLPPTSVKQLIVQVFAGAIVAGVFWYLRTPRRGRHRGTSW